MLGNRFDKRNTHIYIPSIIRQRTLRWVFTIIIELYSCGGGEEYEMGKMHDFVVCMNYTKLIHKSCKMMISLIKSLTFPWALEIIVEYIPNVNENYQIGGLCPKYSPFKCFFWLNDICIFTFRCIQKALSHLYYSNVNICILIWYEIH